jgi:hypothetical protein
MVWQLVVLPGRHTLTVVEGMLKNELAWVGPGPTITDTVLATPPDELLEELLLEELLLEELVPDELLELLTALLSPLPPQAVRAMAAASGNTRARRGNMLISRY